MGSANWKKLLIASLAGASMVLGFEPFGFYPVSVISLAVLFFLWRNLSPLASFQTGLLFGYGMYLCGVSWVYVSLSTYGGMPLWMGSIAVLGFTGILSLIIATLGYVQARINLRRPVLRLLVLPFLWVIFEWVKSWLLTGFPWLDVGYTQTNTWFFALAPIGGIYLVSFSVAFVAAALAIIATRKATLYPVLLILCAVFGSWQLDKLQWSEAVGETIQVGVVQPNVPINQKWQHPYRDKVITKLVSLTHSLHDQQAVDLIVWPETALPIYLQQTDMNFWHSITPEGTALLTGLVDSQGSSENLNSEVYNAALLSCDGSTQIYRKRHLVPFGEYLPLRFLFNWVLEYLDLPMSDFSSWQGQQPLSCDGAIKIGLSICYEDAFAAEYRAHVGDATILVNISEDAWFGDSLAPHQRTQMAQMRARELGRPMVRSSNPGPSFVIDERGVVKTISGQYQEAVLNYPVQPHYGETLFKRYGNWIVVLSFLMMIFIQISVGLRSTGKNTY